MRMHAHPHSRCAHGRLVLVQCQQRCQWTRLAKAKAAWLTFLVQAQCLGHRHRTDGVGLAEINEFDLGDLARVAGVDELEQALRELGLHGNGSCQYIMIADHAQIARGDDTHTHTHITPHHALPLCILTKPLVSSRNKGNIPSDGNGRVPGMGGAHADAWVCSTPLATWPDHQHWSSSIRDVGAFFVVGCGVGKKSTTSAGTQHNYSTFLAGHTCP